jgi:hypothetical protein
MPAQKIRKQGPAKPKPKTDSTQHARFVEAAKKAEADEASDAMDKAFRRLKVTRISLSPNGTSKTS